MILFTNQKKILLNYVFPLLLFAFSVILRLWHLNEVGRTWDEQAIVEKGYDFVQLAKSGDFSNPYWYNNPDHPPFSNYLYGLAATKDFIRYDKSVTLSYPYSKGSAIFTYDLTNSKYISILFSSLGVLLVYFLGLRYFSFFVATTASIILAMIPQFLGYSQLVTHESLILFFFTAAVFSYLLYFEKRKLFMLITAGLLTGLALEIKQSNILLYVFLIISFFIWNYFHKKNRVKITKIVFICMVSFVTYFIVWPMPLFHINSFINFTYTMWFKNGGKIPELIFGKHIGAPIFFYVLAYLVTTPVCILALSLIGIYTTLKRKTWIYVALFIWFLIPFLLSLFHERQQMVRYIIEFYAPLSLLAAVGYEGIVRKFIKTQWYYISIVPLFIYLLLTVLRITPYYLDYYNELVGGTHNVYNNNLFFIGEWGQGLRNPGIYIAKHAKQHAVIGYVLDPSHTLYRDSKLVYKPYVNNQRFDYIVINTFYMQRIGFKTVKLNKNYSPVYKENADGAVLATVYKHK